MRKGVSPVVATVLLIAIAVISAVAVWYWVAPLTSPPATPPTTQYAFVVTTAYKNLTNSAQCVSLDIKNSGGMAIPAGTGFLIRFTNGTASAAYVNITAASAIPSGSTVNVNITNGINNTTLAISSGSYILRIVASPAGISGFTDVYFTC